MQSKPPQTPRRRKSRESVSEDVLLAKLKNSYAWCLTVRYVAIILSLGVFCWMATPLADAIAGKNTNFNINITIALTVAFGASTVALAAHVRNVQKRSNHLEGRKAALEARVDELQKELQAYRTRD